MTHVVTRLCQGNKDTTCVTVCPVDCFYIVNEPTAELPDQLYISPSECIDCSACIEACPWEAIVMESDVPENLAADTELNAQCDDQRDLFEVAENVPNDAPGADAVAENKSKWGWPS